MIAGEFDLSIGSMIGFAGMMLAIPALVLGLAGVSLAVLFAFAVRDGAGLGQRLAGGEARGCPRFIVTLAFYFVLRGSEHSRFRSS